MPKVSVASEDTIDEKSQNYTDVKASLERPLSRDVYVSSLLLLEPRRCFEANELKYFSCITVQFINWEQFFSLLNFLKPLLHICKLDA